MSSLLTTTLEVTENTFCCKVRVFTLLKVFHLIDGESHMFVYLQGRAEIYIRIFKLIPRGTIHPDHFLQLSIKHALKDVPSLCLQL